LLVLPLIDLFANGSQDQDLGAVLTDHAAQFGAFLLTFVIIARSWRTHHRLLERVGNYDEPFLLANLAWVLTIVVLPFSTAVIADFGTQRLSVAIYVGTIALNSALMTVMRLLVVRRPVLQRPGDDGLGLSPLSSVVATGLTLLALAVGVAFRAVNFYGLLLLLLTGPLVWLLQRTVARNAH
jgi:uncharacterized membrane protein